MRQEPWDAQGGVVHLLVAGPAETRCPVMELLSAAPELPVRARRVPFAELGSGLPSANCVLFLLLEPADAGAIEHAAPLVAERPWAILCAPELKSLADTLVARGAIEAIAIDEDAAAHVTSLLRFLQWHLHRRWLSGSESFPEARSEQARAILDMLPDLIRQLDREGRVLYANEAYCRYFGLPIEKLLGKVHEFDAPIDDIARVAQQRASLNPLRPMAVLEHRAILPGDRQVWLQWTVRALFDNTEPRAFLEVGRDITSRVVLEREQRRMRMELATRERAAAVRMAVERIAVSLRSAIRNAGEGQGSDGGLATLLENLQEFARDRQAMRQAVRVGPWLEGIAMELRSALPEGASFDVNTGSEVSTFRFDTEMMRRAMLNVCLNAIRATKPGGTIRVVARRAEVAAPALLARIPLGPGEPPPFGALLIIVEDEGPGVPAHSFERALEPFFLIEGNGGAGLGLPVARKLVEAHNGVLWLERANPQGTRVAILIPTS